MGYGVKEVTFPSPSIDNINNIHPIQQTAAWYLQFALVPLMNESSNTSELKLVSVSTGSCALFISQHLNFLWLLGLLMK